MLGKTQLSDNIYFRIYFVLCLKRLRSPLPRQTESSSDFPCPLAQQALDCYLAYAPCCFLEIMSYLFFILSSVITFGLFHYRATELPSQSDGLAPWIQRAFAEHDLPYVPSMKGTKMETQVTLERPLK